MMKNDLYNELSSNFTEYAVAVNTDRAIPDSKSGLKPVAKRILYGTFDNGYYNSKPHVKCANIVGNVMADWHPHGDSSIYGALVRLAQPWVMRYPLIDFHGSMGNRDGDGPAAYRYTEARLAKISEDGMLNGIRKQNVDFTYNYSETKDEPITLPALFPNLLCNPNTGIGVAMACNWLPHNLNEVAQAIYDYIDGKEPMLPGPDFPTGGLIINKNDIPNIMKTGKGSVVVRGKYKIEDNNIVFYELPYGVATESLMEEIGKACDEERIKDIKEIRNESNRKGFRLVIECEKNANLTNIINLLFKETNLQTSISYNQVALVDKTPTELNLEKCIKIYIDHNVNCITRETNFDINKISNKLEILNGLLKALEDIDNIITLIKKSESSNDAKNKLMEVYNFSEIQAKAIVDMKLGKLAGLERKELQQEKNSCEEELKRLNLILKNPIDELRKRLEELVKKYGDARKTELIQLSTSKEEKEIEFVAPEECVVIMSESGLIKRVPTSSFKIQKRNGKGIKTQDDIPAATIKTNTIDNLMIFTNQGKVYRLLVNDIPVGTNSTKGQPVNSLISMEPNEKPTTIYSIYRDTDAQFVLFTTKNGLVKKTSLEEYLKTKKKTGIAAITIKENDKLASVTLIKDENLLLITKNGIVIRFNSNEITPTSRTTSGVKGISLDKNDEIVTILPIRNSNDNLALFTKNGLGKKIKLSEFPLQKRGGKGLLSYKIDDTVGEITGAILISDEDNILTIGNTNSICISAIDIPLASRNSIGNQIIKDNNILSVSKI